MRIQVKDIVRFYKKVPLDIVLDAINMASSKIEGKIKDFMDIQPFIDHNGIKVEKYEKPDLSYLMPFCNRLSKYTLKALNNQLYPVGEEYPIDLVVLASLIALQKVNKLAKDYYKFETLPTELLIEFGNDLQTELSSDKSKLEHYINSRKIDINLILETINALNVSLNTVFDLQNVKLTLNNYNMRSRVMYDITKTDNIIEEIYNNYDYEILTELEQHYTLINELKDAINYSVDPREIETLTLNQIESNISYSIHQGIPYQI